MNSKTPWPACVPWPGRCQPDRSGHPLLAGRTVKLAMSSFYQNSVCYICVAVGPAEPDDVCHPRPERVPPATHYRASSFCDSPVLHHTTMIPRCHQSLLVLQGSRAAGCSVVAALLCCLVRLRQGCLQHRLSSSSAILNSSSSTSSKA